MPWLLIRRAGAYLVDICLLFLILLPVGQLIRRAIGWPTSAPTGQEVWLAAVLKISVPSWIYFILSDRSARGATLGKRLLGLHVARVAGGRVGTARALARTAVKLVPWETAHLAGIGLAGLGLERARLIGVTLANGLVVVYLAVAAWTRGRRSVHDFVAETEVCPAGSQSKLPEPSGTA
jgi:uncharacterized RDD family membrane protein YckC